MFKVRTEIGTVTTQVENLAFKYLGRFYASGSRAPAFPTRSLQYLDAPTTPSVLTPKVPLVGAHLGTVQ